MQAIASVNSYAGQALITPAEEQALADERTSTETLARVLQKVRSLGSARL
jgi:hypothetical protein